MRRLARALAAVLALLGAGACGGNGASEARAPRHLVIGQITSAVTLDPHGHDQSQTASTLSHFYEPLVTFGTELELKPALAVRWENPTETTWRFHLRRGVTFHDGRAFGAEDVAQSLRRALSPASHVRYYIESIQDIRVIDDATVELTTRHPAPVLLNRLAFVPIVPRDLGAAPVMQPVGTGPYRFVSGRPGGAIAGERYAGYWGPKPVFEQVTVLALADAQERAEAVASGRADIVSNFPVEYWSRAQRQPNVHLVSRQGLGVVMLAFSQKPGSPFADVRVRRAIAHAVDRDRIVREAMNNLAAPLDQIVPPTVVGYSAGLTAVPYDSEEALRLLKEAGYPAGFDAEMLTADAHADVGAAVVKQLAEIGIRIKMQILPQKDFYDTWSAGEVPLSLVAWAPSTGDASGAFEPLLHSPTGGYGRFNRISYHNAALDRLIELSDQTQRPNDRREQLASAAQIVRDEIPVLPLVLRHDLYAVRADLDWRPRLDRRVRAFEVKPAAPSSAP